MLKSSSLFYSVALAALMLTAPVTVRAEDLVPTSGTVTTSSGVAVGEKVGANIEKHRDHIDARRSQLDAKIEAWKTAHPGEALPAELQEHVDRVENRMDKRDAVLDKREEIRDAREALHEKRQEVREERREIRSEVKENVKDRVDKRHDRREGRKEAAH